MESNIRAFDMDDEFALCWNNFQDNLSSGFQTLFDRGDLVDVTLAVDGKLLQAHKIVLAICSPYFQEMFITNPCKHPIIILKDVTFHVMSELLQFMYQGVVNVKHTDLAAFMKIAQSLQIKGLAAIAAKLPINYMQSNNSNNSNPSKTNSGNATEPIPNANVINTKTNATLFSNKEDGASPTTNANKRHIDFNGAESLTMFTRKIRRSLDTTENDISADSMENMSSDEMFLPPIPQISMMESSRFDIHNVKRETEPLLSPGGIRNIIPPGFNFEYNSNVYSKNVEYPNDLHMSNDYPKTGAGNHMDIPAGGNITMLSSTSLLHGNCIFNRNNTVATQQVAPGEKWSQGKLEFMLSQRGKPLLLHDNHTFGIQYIRKDKKYWQCNLSRKFNCKARVTTTETGEIIVTNNEHCHTEIRQHLRKDYKGKLNNFKFKDDNRATNWQFKND